MYLAQTMGTKNWLKYFAVALLPLTVFYFLVVILRISVASSHLIFALQCLLSPLMQRIFESCFNASAFSFLHNILSKILFSIIFWCSKFRFLSWRVSQLLPPSTIEYYPHSFSGLYSSLVSFHFNLHHLCVPDIV